MQPDPALEQARALCAYVARENGPDWDVRSLFDYLHCHRVEEIENFEDFEKFVSEELQQPAYSAKTLKRISSICCGVIDVNAIPEIVAPYREEEAPSP